MPRSFDKIAPVYATLEKLCFGQNLQNIRIAGLSQMKDPAQRVLLLGDGYGALSIEILRRFPQCRIDSIDISPGMLEQARAQIEKILGEVPGGYQGICADALETDFGCRCYDYIGLNFFLDCFSSEQCRRIIDRCSEALKPDGLLAYGDFTLPEKRIGRAFGIVLIRLLYLGFKMTTGLKNQSLPKIEWPDNLKRIHQTERLGGLLEAKTFKLRSATPESRPRLKNISEGRPHPSSK